MYIHLMIYCSHIWLKTENLMITIIVGSVKDTTVYVEMVYYMMPNFPYLLYNM